jgi:MFS family permease
LFLIGKNVKELNSDEMKKTVYTHQEKEEKGNTISALIRRPHILFFLLAYIIYSFVYTQHRFALPLTADEVFGESGASKFGVLMSVNAFTVLFLTVGVTAITKRFKPLINIMIAGLFYALGFGMLGLVNSFPLFILSTIIWTVGEILVVTNFGVYLADNSPFNAIGSLSWSVGGALGTSIAGKFIQETGLSYIWLLTFILSVCGMVGMYSIYIIGKKKHSLEVELSEEKADVEEEVA